MCVVGHFYFRKLGDYYCMQPGTDNLNFNPKEFQVIVTREKRFKLRQCIFRAEILNFDLIPDVVFIQIGENDICGSTNSEE